MLKSKASKKVKVKGITPMKDYDYDKTETGAKTVTWDGLDKRIKNLYILQDKNRPAVKEYLKSLGYDIVDIDRVSDGWGDGFMVDEYKLVDKRNGESLTLRGYDDNTALYKNGGLWGKVPNAVSWLDVKGA